MNIARRKNMLKAWAPGNYDPNLGEEEQLATDARKLMRSEETEVIDTR